MKKIKQWKPKPKQLEFTTPTLKVIRDVAYIITTCLIVFTLYTLPGLAAIFFISIAAGFYCLIYLAVNEPAIFYD